MNTADLIFAYMAHRRDTKLMAPTINELVGRIGVCRETIRANLHKLIVQGRIRRTRNHERGWEIVTVASLREPQPTKSPPPTPAQQASEISRIYANCMARDGVVGRIG